MKAPSPQQLVQLLLLLVLLTPFAGFLLLNHLQQTPAPAGPVPEAEESDKQGLQVTWLGTGTVHVTDGETSLITDAFFSRPPLHKVLFSGLAPNPSRIRAAMSAAGIDRLDAVIPLHSHYDHLLDAPWVAGHYDAVLIGSHSSANAARGAGLSEALIREVGAGDELRLGQFRLQFVRSRHAPMAPILEQFTGQHDRIARPFSPPAPLNHWRAGEVLSLVLIHPAGRILIHTSAGFIPGALDQYQVDLALLSSALLSRQTERFRRDYFQQVVAASGATRVIPVHWDDPFSPLSQTVKAMPFFLDNSEASLNFLRQACQKVNIEMQLIRPFDRVHPQLRGQRDTPEVSRSPAAPQEG